jgi:hypothetical protein
MVMLDRLMRYDFVAIQFVEWCIFMDAMTSKMADSFMTSLGLHFSGGRRETCLSRAPKARIGGVGFRRRAFLHFAAILWIHQEDSGVLWSIIHPWSGSIDGRCNRGGHLRNELCQPLDTI